MQVAAPDALCQLAQRVARHAGDMARARIGDQFSVEQKSSRLDLVTEVDRSVEAYIVAALLDERPNDGIIGEEGASRVSTSGIDWVIDPIDGTTSFVYGLPGFSVSIAARTATEVVAGVVYAPAFGAMYAATCTGPTQLNDVDARCRSTKSLAEVLLATGFSADDDRRTRQAVFVGQLLPRIRDIRRMGSAALDLAAVGAGQLDAYVESGLNPWDYEAGALIARRAGATVIVEPDLSTGKAFVAAIAPGVASALIGEIDALGGRKI